jgi:hypothetical protein
MLIFPLAINESLEQATIHFSQSRLDVLGSAFAAGIIGPAWLIFFRYAAIPHRYENQR